MTKQAHDAQRRVFVVHGRDLAIRQAVFDFLRAIGLSPLEWNQAIRLTAKPAPYVGEILDAAFAHAQAVVVLLTPDDEARLRSHFVHPSDAVYEADLTPQPRQNVLFEAGMAMGRSENRTILVQLGDTRPFSDMAGRHVVLMDNTSVKRQELAQRLELAGCLTDLTGTDWHSAGNFVVSDDPPDVPPDVPEETPPPPPPPPVEMNDEEEPGFLEKLAAAEDALPAFTSTMESLTEDIQEIGDTAQRFTEEMEASDERGGGSRARLAVALRFAQALEPVASRTEQFVDEQRVHIRDIEGGLEWLFERIRSGDLSDEDRDSARKILESLVSAAEPAEDAIGSMKGLIATFSQVGRSARPVGRVLSRLSGAYESLIGVIETWLGWGATASQILEQHMNE